MNYTELVASAPTKTLTYYADHEQSIAGAQANIYDYSTGTSFGILGHHGGDGDVNIYLNFTATWTSPCTVKRVYCVSQLATYGGNYRDDGQGGKRNYWIQLLINGTWTTIDQYYIKNALGSNRWGYEDYNRDLTTGWNNVTGVTIHEDCNSYSYEGDRQQYARYYLYEFNVYREKYEEVMRIRKNNSTIRIGGVENSALHKLKIKDNDMIRSIPLVDASDPLASPLKICINSSGTTKHLALAD